ncbi:MAG: glycoside hydrolase family 2 protein [Candidatus Thorarchaeota archaeon]
MKISLNGEWKFLSDTECIGIKNEWWGEEWIYEQYSYLRTINLPNNWNIIPELDKYEGIVWFFYIFDIPADMKNLENFDIFIQFKAVNYETSFWINGTKCGIHNGNFLPFKFQIKPNLLEKKNCIAVRVENFRKKNRIPSRSRDWFNWGGIYRDIDLFFYEKNRIDWVGVKTTILKGGQSKVEVLYELKTPQLASDQLKICWKLFYLGNISSQNLRRGEPIQVDDGIISNHSTQYSFSFHVKEAKIWTIDDPQLYQLQMVLPESQEPYVTRFGIREIKIVGSTLYLINKPISLQGVSLHEELFPYGRAIPLDKRREDVLNIKKLGFNALRTGHYPHDESIYEICDEEGLLVLEEIPVYWGNDFSSKKVLKKAARMLTDMIRRDFNHPSIICWSTGNEIPILNKDCRQFMSALVKHSKTLDTSRLTIFVVDFWAALVAPKEFVGEIDILCVNEYIGWYYFSVYNLNIFLDCLHQRFRRIPVFVTEFGAGAQYGVHDSSILPMKYSEERQASILGHSIKVMNSKAYINAWFIWVYRDFQSHMRLNQFQNGYNRKGIVSERNEKKLITQCFPSLAEKKMEKNQIRHYGSFALLFYVIFYPTIRIFAIFVALVITKFSDWGDMYYKKGKW